MAARAILDVRERTWEAEVREGPVLVGRISGSRTPVVLTIERVRGRVEQVLPPTLESLASRGLGPVHYWRMPDDPADASVLGRAGLAACGVWHRVERELTGFELRFPSPFTTGPLSEDEPAGQEILGATFARAPGYEHASPRVLLAHFEIVAGEDRDADLWCLARYGGRPCGVLLMHRTGDVGTHLALGLAPWARGRGWGAQLHALGLQILARHGARTYSDDTWAENQPMLSVFARNDCVVTGSVELFVRSP